MKLTILTDEQAQQIEEALNWAEAALEEHGEHQHVGRCAVSLATIRAARAQKRGTSDIVSVYINGYNTGYDNGLKAAPVEPVKQEPVAWAYTRKGIYDKLTELGASITKSCCNVPDKRCGADEWVLQTVQIELLIDALVAPVRTKDLTPEEIEAVWIKTINSGTVEVSRYFARAVIEKFKEKNK